MRKRNIELMAPAGSYESLTAAIQAGADSVYFGIEQLNMRARSSSNFTLDDLVKIAEVCRSEGIKSYITLNTILYDHDINLMKKIIDAAHSSGITAVIATDHAVLNYAKKIGFPVHISTQANISNIDTIEFYAVYADVMVMARELTLMQVATITRDIARRQITGPSGELVRVEVFSHGALCMAVSGKCYLSLHSDNASANRGACIQNCRKSYIVTEKEHGTEFEIDNEYIMSAKDLCTIDFIDKIIGAGVSVLKIEGRGRSADYVHTVVSCYREAIDAYNNGTYGPAMFADWKSRLSTVFNRGFWDGYYLGRKLGEWSDTYGSKATQKKTYIGRGLKYFDRSAVAEFQLDAHSLQTGTKIMVTGPTTGVVWSTVEEIRVENETRDLVKKGETFSIPMKDRVRPSDKLYKLEDV
ncbi:putative protease [Arcticibacter pallidicorallinus]|uniref:Putative protease n=1 Tax=Arcticibacter pallidicorallinus TaxID=1259464 RepID=A0A2T0U7Z3_9SPHI|nr:peptidase U32 family protein [Arcticibacter pallidicorallinus]PRY53978.1 putative protease [Arcticibacter pallidicorallinus]